MSFDFPSDMTREARAEAEALAEIYDLPITGVEYQPGSEDGVLEPNWLLEFGGGPGYHLAGGRIAVHDEHAHGRLVAIRTDGSNALAMPGEDPTQTLSEWIREQRRRS